MLSALDLVGRIESGQLTPLDVLELCAEAIADREGEIGAFTVLDFSGAHRRAQLAALSSSPLRGLPVGMKDIFDTVDFPTAYGSSIYSGHRPWLRKNASLDLILGIRFSRDLREVG